MAGTVPVACKAPHGYRLQLHDMVDHDEPVMGGGFRQVKRAVQIGERVRINGAAHPVDKAPLHQLIGGTALTHGVDADWWASWLKQNADTDMVKNRVIYAADKPSYVEGKAKELIKDRSGLEPIDPNRLPRGIEKAA